MNRGDARAFTLDIYIGDEPITSDYADDIELTFNKQNKAFCVQKSLKQGNIVWNQELAKYTTYLSQEDTFKLTLINTVQLRVLKDGSVVSSAINSFILGGVNSKEVLT